MRKVFTLFCVLMAAFFSIGVANAQSPVAFQTSPEPTDDAFNANTHWFIMTLKGRFITTTVHDESGNFKVSSTNVADISTDEAWWCVVGDDTKGYTFYNKAAGTKQVLGIQNLTGDGGDLNTYGASRAKMYAATTTNSTELKGVGITFDFKTSSTDKEYYVCLKGTNRYLNERGSYLAYWDNSAALGNDGSCVKFYDASTYWYDKYLGSYQTLATKMHSQVGTTAFTYPESAVTTFENSVKEKLNGVSTNVTYAEARRLKDELQLDAAKTTLRKSINGPAADKIYKLKNPNQRKYIHASLSWTAGQVFPLNQTDNDRSIGFIFEKNENGTYKVKSADTGMYVGPYKNNAYTSTASKDDAVDCYIYAFGDCDSKVIIGTSNDLNASTWFHGNGTVLWNWAALGENSCWQCTEVSLDEFNNLTDKRRASLSSVLLLPGVADKLQSDLNAYDANQTAETWGTLLTNVNNTIDSKYYRINNKRSDADGNVLATDGGMKPKMYTPTDGKKLVSSIWKFKYCEAVGLKLSNVNNPNMYVANLNNAAVNPDSNPFTNYNSGIIFNLSRANGSDYYVIRDGDGNVLNGEKSDKNSSVNYWNGGLNDKNEGSVRWLINEATSLEVALNNNEVDGKSYASVYLPFSISSVNDGVKVFVANEPGTDEVTFTETTHGVKANKGFLLISDNAATTTAIVNIGDGNAESSMLGTLTNLDLTAGKSTYRVFGKNSNGVVGFFTPSSTLNEVKANRGFFTVSNGGALRLNFEDSVVSGIDAIAANQALHNAPIFDLSGRRVMNTVKGGLYIQNGRKFIVK